MLLHNSLLGVFQFYSSTDHVEITYNFFIDFHEGCIGDIMIRLVSQHHKGCRQIIKRPTASLSASQASMNQTA